VSSFVFVKRKSPPDEVITKKGGESVHLRYDSAIFLPNIGPVLQLPGKLKVGAVIFTHADQRLATCVLIEIGVPCWSCGEFYHSVLTSIVYLSCIRMLAPHQS
jgi:hypothetical protein